MQRDAVAALKKAGTKLDVLLKDEFFREALAPIDSLRLLFELRSSLPQAAEAIKATTPSYPFQRVGENAKSYQMVNRVADSCYRIYANCDHRIIDCLLECTWLNRQKWYEDTETLMKGALERKMDAFWHRIPNEDYTGPGLTGEWLTTQSGWLPAMTLDPPWMEA